MTSRSAARQRISRIGIAAILALVGVVADWEGPPPPARAGSEARPDLAMANLQDARIQWVNGRKLLRFTAMMVNVGSGHFQLNGHRTSTSRPMKMRQVIFETSSHNSPVSRRIPTDAVAHYSGDGHNHWHVMEMMRYDLWGGDERLRGAKVGFCFLDSDPWNLSLPGAGPSYYRGAWCKTDPNALNNRMGISIGWGDEYEWFLAFQWVDITGLPNGSYTLRAMVDPYGFFLEEREENQCSYAKLGISGNSVSVHSRGRACATDWSGSPFANDIRWMFDNGITPGCLPGRLYCPNDLVSKAGLATFLVRTFDIPWVAQDLFTDDEGLVHEGAINRVAKAGIMKGCQPTLFCPGIRVTRGQLATYLSRTLDLPPASDDYFTDDNGSSHEDAINRIFEAGISQGCGPNRFCPDGKVTRGALAAFLHRAASN